MSDAATLLRDLERGAPALARCLSPIGRRVVFPKGIPFQARAAKGTKLNATVGQVTDGAGNAMPLDVIREAAPSLDAEQTFLYAPQPGHTELRERWLAWQLGQAGRSAHTGSLPFVTHGLTHGIRLIADLFADDDTTVILQGPAWENYDLLFTLRASPTLATWSFFQGGKLGIDDLARVLEETSGKAVVLLNFPANPTGYSPTPEEAARIVELVTARQDPTVVVIDDAYQGVVHEPGLLDHSLYWQMADAADPERTLVVKVDGATKELLFFPSRIGFLTMSIEDEGAVAAIENKINALIRGSIGGPAGPSQAMILAALREPERARAEFAVRLDELTRRYRALKDALAGVADERIRPLPFNAAYFAMVDLDPSLDAMTIRQRLIDEQSVGTIALPGTNALRIAYCSTRVSDLPEIVSRLEAVVGS